MSADDVVVLGRDAVGTVAESHAMRYYLTECCGASAKGSVNSPTGVCCRACYAAIDPELGDVPDRVEFADGRIRVVERAALVESYGDGLPYDVWKARYLNPNPPTEETP